MHGRFRDVNARQRCSHTALRPVCETFHKLATQASVARQHALAGRWSHRNTTETSHWQPFLVEPHGLAGYVIGVTADRRRHEQAEFFTRQGARVVLGPTMASAIRADDEQLLAATQAVLADPPDYLIATTAVGLQGWFDAACLWGLDDELRGALTRTRILGRGAKVQGALAGAGLAPAWMAPLDSTAEIVAHLCAASLTGLRVAVQHAGRDIVDIAALEAAGARLIHVPAYRLTLPEDLQPVHRLIESAAAGRLDAVTFTSAPAVARLFAVADTMERRAELLATLHAGTLAASIGPVCSAGLRAEGVQRIIEPARPSLAGLAFAVADELGRRRRRLRMADVDVTVQGSLVYVGETAVRLSDRERAVLTHLCAQSGSVVARSALLRDVWSIDDAGSHIVDVTVGRLRRRLGPAGAAIRTVPRRGYWLDATPAPPLAVAALEREQTA